MTQVRDLLRNQTLEDLTSTSVTTVGGRVFPDAAALANLGALTQISDSWKAVHAPTYGQPIPQTGNAQSLTASEANTFEDVIAPTGNQVTMVQFIGLFNADATTPAQVDVAIVDSNGTAYVASSLNVDPSSFANAFQLGSGPLWLDSNVSLRFRVVSGPYASVSIRTYAIDVVR